MKFWSILVRSTFFYINKKYALDNKPKYTLLITFISYNIELIEMKKISKFETYSKKKTYA